MRLDVGIQRDNSTFFFFIKEIEKKENAKNNYEKHRKGVTTTTGPELAYRVQWGRSVLGEMGLSLVKSL